MRTAFWHRLLNRLSMRRRTSLRRDEPRRNRQAAIHVEMLEERLIPANFTAGNIAVLDLAAATTNTTGSILELSPSQAGQASPVQTIGIGSTGANALRFSDSGTSSFLSDSNDGTQLVVAAYNTADNATADLATTGTSLTTGTDPDDRAVATFDGTSALTIQTHYVESTSGNQTRSAATLNDSSFFITDKGGLFTNGATTNSLSPVVNILNARSFGGVVYIGSTKTAISTASIPTATSLTALPGLSTDGLLQDFYLIQSGSNGSTYDVLYTLDQNAMAGNPATINKFSLVGGTWVANGSFSLAGNATGMIAENNGSGAYLYVLTTAQKTNNSLIQLTDGTGWVNSATPSSGFTLTNNTTLYTDTAGDVLKGIAFVPTASATAPTVSSPTSASVGINSATLGGTVASTGSPGVISYGVVYSLTSVNSNPTIGGTGVTQLPGSGTAVFTPFTVSATGLLGTSQYSFAAYAINSAGTTYSSVSTFTTSSANPPTLSTPTDTAITSNSATLGGTVVTNGGASVTESGVVYALTSVNSNPHLGGTGVIKVDTGSPVNSGAFTISATSLSAGMSYTFEAFATNSSGTSYTAATAFTTLAPPTVNTPTDTNLTSTSATLGGNVASNGGSAVTESGVVYALTSVNSNPQLGGTGVTKVDTGSPVNSGAFTVSATGLTGGAGYTFEAFATNANGTTYTAATNFSTAAPNVITAWTFPTVAGAPDNSPSPTYGTGTLATLGMSGYNNANGPNTAANDDIVSTSGTANPNFTENLLRVRGTPNNGWSLAAPQYSQGIELDTSTVGYSNIVFSFNWYSTTQGIRDLQVQYNTGSGWVNYQGPSPTGTFIATSNDYYNAGLSPVNPTIYINLSGIAAANNNPDLGIRLVSAYDSTGTLTNEYASAASAVGAIVPYNNSSGNWRFGDLTFSAGIITTTTLTANPPGGQNPNQNVTFTATVTPASGSQYPSGTVTFYDGTTQIGTTQTVTQVGATNVGTASITLSTLTPGVHGDITAQYAPAAGNGLIASGSSMNLVAGAPTNNPISYTINAPQATGVDVSPVVGQSFTGVVATFTDGTFTTTAGFSAMITWGDGHTSSGTIVFTGTTNETNINGQTVAVSLYTVTGTNTYATAGTYAMSVTITDPNANSSTVNPTARVAYPPLVVTGVATITTTANASLSNQTVATFTDPGLIAGLTSLGISDPTTQFSAGITWGDGTITAGTIVYNSSTQTFSVVGSHTYAQTGTYSISVAVTPLTVSVERIDSSDPTNQNLVGDEDGNTLTDSPSEDFIDQFVIGSAGQASSLYTFSLPTVATTSGNEALTNSSYSVSEGELTLSTNGQFLVTGGYNDTVNAWGPQQTFSSASVINRVIGTISGSGVINTTTDLTDAYTGDNFRGVTSTNGTQFWTAGHSSGTVNDYVHYVGQLGATTSTMITGPTSTPNNPENINTVEIYNGQLYEGVRSVAAGAPAGIYQIGTGLPTTAGQTETLFIQVPQSNPLDINASDKPMSPFDFYMADLNDGNPTINGVNVCYVADGEMGIARYDYTSSGWQFSYYINSTGSILSADYTVDSQGNITATGSFDPNNTSNDDVDTTKAGGVRGLTGRVVTVNGQQVVQLFATTGFGITAQPNPGEKVIEVSDPISPTGGGAADGYTVLATDTGASELTGVAFTPTQTVTSSAHLISASVQVTPSNPSTSSTTTVAYFAVGADAGTSPEVIVYNAKTGAVVSTFYAFAPGFSGGVRVAVDDINGDGTPDIICAAGPSTSPEVIVINGTKLNQLQSNGQIASSALITSFYAFGTPSFSGGVFVSAGTSSTGQNWVVLGAGAGGSAQIQVFTASALATAGQTGTTPTQLASFYAFAPSFGGGVTVAVGDVNGDGKLDIIAGAGPGGGPEVIVVDGTKLTQLQSNGQIATSAELASFYAFAPGFSGGVYVSGGLINGKFDLIIGAGPSGGPQVELLGGNMLNQLQSNGQIANSAQLVSFDALTASFTGGVRVGFSSSFGSSGKAAILTTACAGGSPEVNIFDATSFQSLDAFFALPSAFSGGSFIGG